MDNTMEKTAGHTPGPWRVGKRYDSIVCDGLTGFDDERTLDAYGGHLICESVKSIGNKNLITAAPDLLAALEKLRGEMNALEAAFRPFVDEAIAKAKGELK